MISPARSEAMRFTRSACAGAAPARPSLGKDSRGATLVEFAFVAPILALTILGLFDLGYKSYVSAVLQGTLHEAARMATVGDKTNAQIDAAVNTRLGSFSRGSTITVAKKSYSDFTGVKVAEKITSDTVPLNTYNSTDCYEDYNGNGAYDTDRGKSGMGASEDVVNYEITITYPRLFPLTKLMGLPTTDSVRGSTVLRNQPFGARSTSVTVRCS